MRGSMVPKMSVQSLSSALNKNQSEGLTERINEPPWGRCLQGAVDARWVVVVVVVVASQGVILD